MLLAKIVKPRCCVRHQQGECCCRSCHQSSSDVSTSKILSLCGIATLTNACYTTIAPILPLELAYHYNKHQHQNDDDNSSSDDVDSHISFIFLCFSLGSLITPPLASRHFETSCGGTMKIMSLAMIGMALLFSCLGSVFRLHKSLMMQQLEGDGADSAAQDETYNNDLLIVLICTIQFCIGGLLYYSSATLIRTSNPDRVISFLETAVGIGYILGPVIGSLLYDELGYMYVYRVASVVMTLVGLVTFKIISPLFNTTKKEVEYDDDCLTNGDIECASSANSPILADDLESQLENNKRHSGTERQPLLPMKTETSTQPTILHLLKHPRILVSALCITWINVSWTFVEPILASRLDAFFHLGKKEIGIIFSLSNVVYIPAAFLLQFVFVGSNMRRRRFIILFSIAFTPLAVLLIGSNSVQCLIFGMLLLGLLPTPVWIMLLPSMQEDSLNIYPHHRRVANDLTAGIYNSFMILGQVVGYIIGPALNASVGFGNTTCIVGGLILIQSISYYSFVLRNVSDGRLKSVRKV